MKDLSITNEVLLLGAPSSFSPIEQTTPTRRRSSLKKLDLVPVIGSKIASSPVKRVQFSQTKSTKKVSSHKSMSDKQKKKIWFNAEELNSIHAMVEALVYSLDNGIDIKTSDDLRRGLEDKTEEGNWKRFKNTKEAVDLVLDLQASNADADTIARKYRNQTTNCRGQARSLAREDAAAAGKYVGVERPMFVQAPKRRNSAGWYNGQGTPLPLVQ